MIQECHAWQTLEELQSSCLDQGMEQPLGEAVDPSQTQQARADERNHALAPINLLTRFSSKGGHRRSVDKNGPDADSITHAPDVDTDNEQLETVALSSGRMHVNDEQSCRPVGKHSRQRERKQGPQRQLIHSGM